MQVTFVANIKLPLKLVLNINSFAHNQDNVPPAGFILPSTTVGINKKCLIIP